MIYNKVVGDEYNEKSKTNSINLVRSKARKHLESKLSKYVKYDTKNPHKKYQR
jgi:hypothetical protein